jgi:hypothetical protein
MLNDTTAKAYCIQYGNLEEDELEYIKNEDIENLSINLCKKSLDWAEFEKAVDKNDKDVMNGIALTYQAAAVTLIVLHKARLSNPVKTKYNIQELHKLIESYYNPETWN